MTTFRSDIGMSGYLRKDDLVCVNAHDRCYEGVPCPYCEPPPSWQQKMKDTIATLTAERDAARRDLGFLHAIRDSELVSLEAAEARAARLEEAFVNRDGPCDKWAPGAYEVPAPASGGVSRATKVAAWRFRRREGLPKAPWNYSDGAYRPGEAELYEVEALYTRKKEKK